MKNKELIYKNSWVYKLNNGFNINDLSCVKNIEILNDNISIINISKVSYNHNLNYNIDRLKHLKEKLNDDKEFKDFMQMFSDTVTIENHCQILILKDKKVLIILCDDIRDWEDFFSKLNLKKVTVINKKIINYFIEKEYCSNILSLTISNDENDSMIDAFNIHGSNIQLSDNYIDTIENKNSEIINCIFQPKDGNFLITLRKDNNIELSKYVSSSTHLKTLNDICLLLYEYDDTI